MSAMRIPALAVALCALGGCGRKTVYIGRVVAFDAGAPTGDAPVAPAEGGADAPPACLPDPPAVVVFSSEWNCGSRCFRDDAVPMDTVFTGALDPAGPPLLKYPLAGSTHPLNLPDITIQWKRTNPGGQTTFRARFTAVADQTRRYDFLFPCRVPPPNPTPNTDDFCTYPLPRQAWAALASENAGGEMDLVLDASDRVSGTVVSSASMRISFTPAASPEVCSVRPSPSWSSTPAPPPTP
jgi:hypothetical protein